jgi:hypothetical protein
MYLSSRDLNNFKQSHNIGAHTVILFREQIQKRTALYVEHNKFNDYVWFVIFIDLII